MRKRCQLINVDVDILTVIERIETVFSVLSRDKAGQLFREETNRFFPGTLRVLTIMPNRPVRDQWEYPRKMEQHFPIKPGQPVGMAPATFYSFSEFPN